ncbi:MAG TPA: BTAD domain-containing putative transcriptional regulator [Candidatus Limnocylindrales bacterium]
MDFLLLGPLEVWHAGQPVNVGRRRNERCLLGLLLLEAGRMIPVDRLCDLLWDGKPPDNARGTLQSHISRLRSALDPDRDGGLGVRLAAQGDGYVIHVAADMVDAHRFRALVSNVDAMADPARRATILRGALALWRGQVLADVASDRLRDRIGTGLTELRMQALESFFEASLEAGLHREIITELVELVAAHPFRERLVHALMLALYRDGRQADALATYQQITRETAERTGLDTSATLARLHQAILLSDPTLDHRPPADRAGRVPKRLPPDIAHFVGRDEELAGVTELATSERSGFVQIAAIYGPGGVGKSALATRAAHSLADRFPDGQLYLDLQGSTPGLQVMDALDALGRLLRALGVENRRVPNNVQEAAAVFRELTVGKRMLFLFDNAGGTAQVRPILPSEPDCFVIVTSRTMLSTLDNAVHTKLDVLTDDESAALIGRFDGRAASPSEREHVTAIVRLCGRLPLAIRVAAARLGASPQWTLKDFAENLKSAHSRLDLLQQEDLDVRASIMVSHRALQTAHAELLGYVGLLDCSDIPLSVAAALVDRTLDGAHELLRKLVDEQLIRAPSADRYGMHDLIRLYVREEAALDEATDHPAFLRALDHYAATAATAAAILFPGNPRLPTHEPRSRVPIKLSNEDDARAWIDSELANIISLARQVAHAGGLPATALMIKLATALLYPLYDMLCRWADLYELQRLAVGMAVRSGDRAGEAYTREGLACGLLELGRLDEATVEARLALGLYRAAADTAGEAGALLILSSIHRCRRDFVNAAECLRQGVEVCRAGANPRFEANMLDNLGSVYQALGRFPEAVAHHQEGLRIRREQETRLGVAASLENLGWAYLRAGQPELAISPFEEGFDVAGQIRHTYKQASILWGLATALHRLGRLDRARQAWRDAVRIFRELNTMDGEEASRLLAQDEPELPMTLQGRV